MSKGALQVQKGTTGVFNSALGDWGRWLMHSTPNREQQLIKLHPREVKQSREERETLSQRASLPWSRVLEESLLSAHTTWEPSVMDQPQACKDLTEKLQEALTPHRAELLHHW